MNVVVIILSLTCVILIAFCVIIIIYTTRQRANYIKADKCNKPLGEFAVQTDVSASKAVIGCEENDNSECVFVGITSLSEAINKCNQNSNLCNRFSYNEGSGSMIFIDLLTPLISAPGTNLYTKQVGISS